jgi:hypothetical protein
MFLTSHIYIFDNPISRMLLLTANILPEDYYHHRYVEGIDVPSAHNVSANQRK